MRKGNSVDCVAGFKVMNRSIDMSARMGAQMQIADEVEPAILLPKYRPVTPRVHENIFRE
jgi:hypothetical protein